MSEPTLVRPPAQGFKPPQQLISGPLSGSHQAWHALRGDRFAPSRKEIEPARFKPVLGSIFVMDVLDDGADFRFVLGGESVVHLMGRRLRGKLLSGQPQTPFFKGMARLFVECVRTKAPVAVGPMRTVREGNDYLEIEVLVMPLSDTGTSVTSLLGAIHFSRVRDPVWATGGGGQNQRVERFKKEARMTQRFRALRDGSEHDDLAA